MIARNQLEFDGECGVAREELVDELAAPTRQNCCILETVKDRRVHPPEPIEAALPVGVAFFDPFPRQRPILMSGFVVPGHPTGGEPGLSTFFRDRPRTDTHHVEGGSDENQPLNFLKLLSHEPRNPAAERVADDGQWWSSLKHCENRSRIDDPIGQRVVGKCAFRFPESTYIVAAESPAFLLTPLCECFALIAPPFGQEPGDEENLPIFPQGTISTNALAIVPCENKRFERAHGFVSTFMRKTPSRWRTRSVISCPPRKLCHSTARPDLLSVSRSRSAPTYGRSSSCVPWLWKTGSPLRFWRSGIHSCEARSVPDSWTSPA